MTVGHGDLGYADVERSLLRHGVTMIVDVRSAPYSRHAPDFSKRVIEELTAVAGISYRWMGDRLGGLPTADETPAADGGRDWHQVARTPAFDAALDELATLARGGRVAILCSELNPARCHRGLHLAPELERRGFEIHHIAADGSASRHQPTLFPPR